MAFFFRNQIPNGTGLRLTGGPRYRELLSRDFIRFFLVNLLTLLGFLPFLLGTLFSVLSSSVLVLIPVCIIGGALAGPALSCMYDVILRSLRDAPGKWFENYKRAWRQNWRQSFLPGILFCLLLGFYIFMAVTFWWTASRPSLGTLAVYFVGLMLITMFFSVYWPQVALFDQSAKQRFQNCILFILRYFWKTLGCSLLQVLYWVALALFLPISVLLLPLTGFWFILFSTCFLLYGSMDEAFSIEEQISQSFPDQAAFYEDDESWLKRKQEEHRKTDTSSSQQRKP